MSVLPAVRVVVRYYLVRKGEENKVGEVTGEKGDLGECRGEE